MSGVFGCFATDGQCSARDRLADMAEVLKLHGYSITRSIYDDTCSLGEAGIQSTAPQILGEQAADVDIAVCGETYGGALEKEILTLYRTGTLQQARDLNGSFVAAIYDKATETLTLVNDRYGLMKTFYYWDHNCFCFAPKIRPLLSSLTHKALRKDAIVDFFLFGYLLGNKTFFESIHQLPPASIVEVSKDGLKITKHWAYQYAKDYDLRPREELVEELGALWQRAVERRIRNDETTIIPLSGGLDSRAILAAALRCTAKDKIITFTFGEPGSFDFEIGKMVARKAGVKNVALDVEKEDFEGQYDLSMDDIEGMIDATPYFPIGGTASVRAYGLNVLSGYIGDFILGSHMHPEMIGAYPTNDADYEAAAVLMLQKDLLHSLYDIEHLLSTSFCGTTESPINKCDLMDSKNKELASIYFEYFLHNHVAKYSYFTVFRHRELFNYRSPFLDGDLVDFMHRIPTSLRFGQTLYRAMLLKQYPELFTLPTKANSGLSLDAGRTALLLRRATLLARAQANRASTRLLKRRLFLDKNKNYVDYDDLLRTNSEYRDYMRDKIARVEQREYFNQEYIERVWNLHMQGKKNYSMLFGLLVTFELFLERYVDDWPRRITR